MTTSASTLNLTAPPEQTVTGSSAKDDMSGPSAMLAGDSAMQTAGSGFTLKPGEERWWIPTNVGMTTITVVNQNDSHGSFWFRSGFHEPEGHAILARSSQTHPRKFGGYHLFIGNNGKVPLYFEVK